MLHPVVAVPHGRRRHQQEHVPRQLLHAHDEHVTSDQLGPAPLQCRPRERHLRDVVHHLEQRDHRLVATAARKIPGEPDRSDGPHVAEDRLHEAHAVRPDSRLGRDPWHASSVVPLDHLAGEGSKARVVLEERPHDFLPPADCGVLRAWNCGLLLGRYGNWTVLSRLSYFPSHVLMRLSHPGFALAASPIVAEKNGSSM